MEEDHHHLTRPLLLLPTTAAVTPATAATDITNTSNTFVDVGNYSNENYHDNSTKLVSSNSKILLRLFSVAVVGILSLWANQEASRGFEIHIENRAPTDSVASRRFQLMYVSNDRATRLVLGTSKFVEAILYPISSISQPNKEEVNRVTLRLAGRNLTHTVTVDSFKEHEFVINLSPSILELETDFDHAMLRAVQQGMARVWLHDNNAPKSLLNGMVEYISRLAGLGAVVGGFSGDGDLAESGDSCWMDEDPVAVAHFLSYCEEKRRGFIQQLNLAMKGRWNDRTVDDALGMPAQHLCGSYVSQKHLPVD
ncbi:hypothetical protein RHGRI_017266 [Rhododendron griersonianum]|uniref:Uncharacterized protein n=1 Tax=Rhododendron griersonianum TaxID=479676 RepID=A0AAV6JX50_9ERIC|nr:hypothetical protein RHGRI_017266 [Rhododendron griersonianum]